MNLLKYLVFVLCFLSPFQIFALDPSCFREVSSFSLTSSNPLQIAVESVDEDIFFVQNNRILPAKIITTEKNPPIRYTITGIEDTLPLIDLDPKTQVYIDPYRLSEGNIEMTIDLGKVYPPKSMYAFIDYTTKSRVRFEASEDGVSYFTLERTSIEDFSLRFLRLTFEKVLTQNSPSVIRSIHFFENVNMRFLVVPTSTDPITAYRGLMCDRSSLVLPPSPGENPSSGVYTTLRFSPNTLYKNDYDQDGIENIGDICPYAPDRGQEDRNYDGRGDACSDDDNDGIIGLTDNCPTIANSDQADKNVNKIGDACEFDTDSDGIPDGVDNALRIKNPDQKDSDNDAIGDVMDNCTLYNPDQLDLNKNGKGDACDRDEEYRKTNDLDKDSVLDFADNCRKIPNSDQSDADRDSIGDACDNCAALQNTDQKDENKNTVGDMCEDADMDTMEGWRDNCPTITNSDQADSDNNGVGDACSDTDNDSIYDSLDICPLDPDTDQKDIDHDDIGDACDSEDDRFLESNKYLFMSLLAFFALFFIGGILYFLRKIQ